MIIIHISDIDPLVLADPSEVIFDPSMIPQMQHNFDPSMIPQI